MSKSDDVNWWKVGAMAAAGTVVVVVGVALISVVTAPVRMASGVVNQTLNASNAIGTYERFHDRWKGYDARLAQIETHKALVDRETDRAEITRLRIELAGMRQSCREVAAAYNADAAKTNRDIFRGREAPAELNMEACSR